MNELLKKNRLPNLDFLRLILASLVMLNHIVEFSMKNGFSHLPKYFIFDRGRASVLIFFVLSGYLIIGKLNEKSSQGRFNFKDFYLNRARRILPLYFLVSSVALFVYHVVLPQVNIEWSYNYKFYEAVIYLLLFLPNVFATLSPGAALEILWSIGIEEQFYLFAPLIFVLRINRRLWILLTIVIVYFLLFNLLHLKYAVFYHYILAGGIISIISKNERIRYLFKNVAFHIIVIFLISIYFLTDLVQNNTSGVIEDGFRLITFSLLVGILPNLGPKLQVKNNLVNYLGQISYGIYVYHVLVIYAIAFSIGFLKKHIELNDNLEIFLMYFGIFLGTYITAHLSYKYFESRFWRIKK